MRCVMKTAWNLCSSVKSASRMERKGNNMENILVSACLLGVCCRYDGNCQQIREFEQKLPALQQRFHLVPVCPEVYGGLPTPRAPAEIRGGRVCTAGGEDVTAAFRRGAQQALQLARRYGCRYAVLKKRSPSCGSGQIYDGTFTRTLTGGDGITAGVLKAEGITVFGEDETDLLLSAAATL